MNSVLTWVPAWGHYLSSQLARCLCLFILLAAILAAVPGYGAVTFTAIDAGLPGVKNSSLAWGDYDGDGDLDLALAGDTGSGVITRIYRNDGAGGFTDINAGLPGVRYCKLAWGDYDNDGNLDLALAGYSSGVRITRIYRNDGAGGFTDINAGLPGILNGDLAWGDYDHDGDLDLALTGNSATGYLSRIYRNDGAGVFTDINAGLPGVGYSALAWGDYDNDGDEDLVVSGFNGNRLTWLFRNNGNDSFTDVGAGLQGFADGVQVWGDYDGDGDLDLALSGNTAMSGSSGRVAVIYRNDGGVFTNISAGLIGVGYSKLAWGDFDNDGDLDLALEGLTSSDIRVACIYRNDAGAFTDISAGLQGVNEGALAWGDYDNDGDLDLALTGNTGSTGFTSLYRLDGVTANTVPSAPGNPRAVGIGSTVTFSWDAAGDAQTPAAGLSYNLRVGTTPGGSEVFSGMADAANGFRRVPALGNMMQRLACMLKLTSGSTLYWSVQAVDGAWAGGAWAPEQLFTPRLQADLQACNAGGVYAGDNIYQETAAQTVEQAVQRNQAAVYQVLVQNDGDVNDRFTLQIPAAPAGWEVHAYDALAGGTEITAQITAPNSWTLPAAPATLAPQASREFRIEVIPRNGSAVDATWSLTVHAAPPADAAKWDEVCLTTRVANTPPVAAGDNYITAEDTPLAVPAPGVLGNDTDADATALTASLDTGPAHGTVSLRTDGSFTYTPSADYYGADCFTYHANDGMQDSATVTVTLAVTAVNDIPVGEEQNVTTDEDVPVHVTLSALPTPYENETFTFRVTTPPAHGRLTGLLPYLTYCPAAGYYGSDSFAFRVFDGQYWSIPARISITVRMVNSPPVCTPLTIEAVAGVSRAVAVLSAATDKDGDALSVTGVTQGAHGAVALAGGAVTYLGDADYTGADQFTATIQDVWGAETVMPVTVQVYRPLAEVRLSASPGTGQSVNTPITIAAAATGGARLEYRFAAGYVLNGVWYWPCVRNWSAASSWQWTPTVAATYTVTVMARDLVSGAVKTAVITCQVNGSLSAVSLAIGPSLVAPVNTQLMLNATPTGGIDVRYRFWITWSAADGRHTQELQAYSTDNTCAWRPNTPGVYTVVVWAREAASRINPEVYAFRVVTFTAP